MSLPRVAFAALLVLLAGCASPTTTQDVAPSPTPTASPANLTAPVANATLPAVGERGPVANERFVLTASHELAFAQPGGPDAPLADVPESFQGSFFVQPDPASLLKPWTGPPSQRAFEAMQDVTLTLRYRASQPAVAATKDVFPAVGAWFGTPERWAVFLAPAAAAPDTLEAGKTYTVQLVGKMPTTGFFVRVGETLAIHPYLNYHTADGSPVSYVVGGPEAAGFVLPHLHFNVSAPTATVVLDKSGALGPNPSSTTTQDPQPVDLEVPLPANAVYVVATLEASSAAPAGPFDADLALLANGAKLGESTGPGPHEAVELGPTALAKAGGKLVAHVAGSGAAGGSFHLVVKAFGP